MSSEEYFCPHCGQRLFNHNCKMKCPRCGYTEDCTDALLVDYERQNARPKRINKGEAKHKKSEPTR